MFNKSVISDNFLDSIFKNISTEDKKIIKIFQSIKRISFGSLICSGYSEELLEKDFSTCKINEANINALKNFIWSSFNKFISLFPRDL